jgi:hypothetical protein
MQRKTVVTEWSTKRFDIKTTQQVASSDPGSTSIKLCARTLVTML